MTEKLKIGKVRLLDSCGLEIARVRPDNIFRVEDVSSSYKEGTNITMRRIAWKS